MIREPEYLAHLEWLGFIQPEGLVVSIPAMLAAQAYINRNITPLHQCFLALLPHSKNDTVIPEIRDFSGFTQTVLDWRQSDLVPIPADGILPDGLPMPEAVLTSYQEVLKPTYAVREVEPKEGQSPWLLLIKEIPAGDKFDDPSEAGHHHWAASPHVKFERLLRETGVPIGLLHNSTHLRLVYAPRGETSGSLTFSVAEMVQTAGRPIFAGLTLLLGAERLFTLPDKQRLPAILSESRKYQNTVSTKLAEQVLAALYELLRGFQAADDQRRGELLREVLADDPHKVYAGLLTVLLRMVFILFAEDRGLLSNDALYSNYYSITGLFERLRAEAGRFPDTMDLRYGAWAQLLTLFRLIYDGGSHGELRLPARKGYLFDPGKYPFLEGRPSQSGNVEKSEYDIPHVPDGVIFRVLKNLLVLDGERLNYRTLDVEQIGSVYETIMGFNLEIAQGRSIAIKSVKKQGAPSTINLEALLAARPADRAKFLLDATNQKLTGQAAEALKNARTIEDLLAALDRKIDKNVTPNVVPQGAMVFQPSDERRRSGSHYTPRSLSKPIVETTLRPILERLGKNPKPEQILDLKVCDPAMGSGAFLVEACRQLGDVLAESWNAHNCLPPIPPDEDELLHARRIIAQHCLYGVDKNPMAVDLAKLSLWLATLAKNHAFTFLDHSLRCGDSLVGLMKKQITAFHWNPNEENREIYDFIGDPIAERIEKAAQFRQHILADRDALPYLQLESELKKADEALILVRLTGDLVISAFFSADKEKKRIENLNELAQHLVPYLGPKAKIDERPFLDGEVRKLRSGEKPISPFHWEIEFPEVFGRDNGGFDAIVGNPPFAGRNNLINGNKFGFFDWLKNLFVESLGNSDLVGYFFRRSFNLLRDNGCFGLIATKTIRQGDTRFTGLRWICSNGGTIYCARRRYKWIGTAAVVISIVHIIKGIFKPPFDLDLQLVPLITAYLFYTGGNEDPINLRSNKSKSYEGYKLGGMGFTFDDSNTNSAANPIALMQDLIEKDPANSQRIFPFIGGEEVNNNPTQSYNRYVIDFNDMSYDEAARWTDLINIVRDRVKPERDKQNRDSNRIYWWKYAEKRPGLRRSISNLDRVLVINHGATSYPSFIFLPKGIIYSHSLVVFPSDKYSFFCILQSSMHEYWAYFFSSTMKDDLRYTPSSCFETFPFPEDFESDEKLEAAGKEYYEFRAQLMIDNNEGLTKTYNRFHDPDETSPEIKKLRELHATMDRVVLDAYHWTDLKPTCKFLLDYEEEEDDEDGVTRHRKKPWRYRWPDDLRDEVLARLLELNKERAEQEQLAGLVEKSVSKKTKNKKPAVKAVEEKKVRKTNKLQPDLMDM